MSYLLARLSEASTWRGFILLLTSVGVSVTPDLVAPIVAAGTGAAGLVGVLTKDKAK